MPESVNLAAKLNLTPSKIRASHTAHHIAPAYKFNSPEAQIQPKIPACSGVS
ncbi:hypothetical protein [Campylobacter curvus]|nr:hypothetical protein [Campylobacter curvus]MBN7287988.1 hypothetical protein [Campylobacter curvus]MDU6827515.1 hypothetical protein [Campylobacter sp.]